MSTHLSDSLPKAKKPHRCYLCGLTISIGEVYVRRSGVSDGDFYCVKMHEKCEEITHDWRDEDWECHDESEFREVLIDQEKQLKGEYGDALRKMNKEMRSLNDRLLTLQAELNRANVVIRDLRLDKAEKKD